MLTKDQKTLFLKENLDCKGIIFGSFNKIPDAHNKKREIWLEIETIMKSNGYDKEEEYLRDAEWKNLRVATMVSVFISIIFLKNNQNYKCYTYLFKKKVDNRNLMGAEGGVEKRLSEIDDLVLEIIGKKKPSY